MNLPNKLTVLRVILIPFFVAALLWENGENYSMRIAAAVIFIVASLTDMLDGKIARKYNLVTNFGKFMDPLADKDVYKRQEEDEKDPAGLKPVFPQKKPTWRLLLLIFEESDNVNPHPYLQATHHKNP